MSSIIRVLVYLNYLFWVTHPPAAKGVEAAMDAHTRAEVIAALVCTCDGGRERMTSNPANKNSLTQKNTSSFIGWTETVYMRLMTP